MTTPFWCLLIAALLPYLLAGAGSYFRAQLPGGVDNKQPRSQAAKLEGAGARAYAAQQNAWEALAVFTVAVVVAHLAGADEGLSAIAAVLFIVTRVLHPVFYLANLDLLRSSVFMIGAACCVWLLVLAAQA